jgi:hypothetical protein
MSATALLPVAEWRRLPNTNRPRSRDKVLRPDGLENAQRFDKSWKHKERGV